MRSVESQSGNQLMNSLFLPDIIHLDVVGVDFLVLVQSASPQDDLS